MGEWIRVAGVAELPTEGIGLVVKADGLQIALFQWNEKVHAVEDLCPHMGFPLSEGVMTGGEVICSWHGWRIRLEDGSCRRERERARTFPCEIRGADIYIQLKPR